MIYYRVRTQKDGAWGQREQTEAARAVLLFALRREYGIEHLPQIAADELGKPCFPQMPQIAFNYSHCRAGVLCGVGDAPVGVDAETVRNFKSSLIRRICHPAELADLDAQEDAGLALTRIWVAKEAYLKCTGTGIREDLRLLDLSGVCFRGEEYFRGKAMRIWTLPEMCLCACSERAEQLILKKCDF